MSPPADYDDMRAYIERDPDWPGAWRWWLAHRGGDPWDQSFPRGSARHRREARRAARRALADRRYRRDAEADPTREEIR